MFTNNENNKCFFYQHLDDTQVLIKETGVVFLKRPPHSSE